MTTQTEALKLALEALQVATTPLAKDRQEVLRAITAIKEVLAQPEQEPVAWMDANDPNRMTAFKWENIGYHNTPLYTTPPPVPEANKLKPLTDAIDWVKKRRDDFIDAHGVTDPDTGALEFGRGRNAEAKAEYVEELEEIIEGLLTIEAAHGVKE